MCVSQYVSQYVTPLVGLVTGALIGVFAEPIRTFIFRPAIKVSFEKNDPSCVARTPSGAAPIFSEAIYIRVRVENPKSQMAKSCRAFLVKVEEKNSQGIFNPTIYADSLPLGWSCQQDPGRPIDLPSGVSQFVDIISTDKGAPARYDVHLMLYPHRYRGLFDDKPKILRLTILVTGDGARAGKTTIVFEWRGAWDTFKVEKA